MAWWEELGNVFGGGQKREGGAGTDAEGFEAIRSFVIDAKEYWPRVWLVEPTAKV